ncbi:MAG: HAMP domain-containing sensor histidine kinase, partial [Proteobacteria bacterium]|nr:HAMP domain-containing sensor histidine kinase [Pseudomonadota bacterium]
GLVMVLMGSVLLFIWGQRQTSFIRQQRSFVSSVTHELRTPLASMHLALETLLTRTLPESTKKQLLNMSLIDIERLTRLVNQILISSRLDRGLAMFQDDVQVIRINERVRSIVKGLEYLDSESTTRVTIDCPEELSFRTSDNAFNLIIGNLIENAFKYSAPRSPVNIHVQPDGGMIRFSIEDRGVGLDKRQKRKIFKMFYRGAQASTKAIPGTGLGLFIVKTSLEQMNGKISVESDGRGEGSVFHVWLPSL